ncbi:MAG: glycoside hydrolase family 57 protein [Candidatus Sulfobium sp.]|jgi:alpha-amylase/alpha-mannosidase (GH57 family)
MTDKPLHVVFLWHMHQPFYKDPMKGGYRLPWVRLHGTKDYLDMVEILDEFPGIRQNFNLVPSLLEQLTDYSENGASDVYLEMSRKPASGLDQEQRRFILENFFLAHWDNMIGIFPRYRELLIKRGTHPGGRELARAARYFNDQDFLDIQVLFNLCWIDPLFREKDPFLNALSRKGRNFSEEDKRMLIEKQMEILGRIISAYREKAAKGRIELSFSPFYHPILPLLCDTDIAGVSMPEAKLPGRRFRHPEDAVKQVRSGLEYFERTFGFRPAGMWPPEGSVSEEVLGIVSREGIKWVATDEGVLSNSLRKTLRDTSGEVRRPDLLYRPYSFNEVSIVFRDRVLSDQIGFVYSQWDARKAARDLIRRMLSIRDALPAGGPWLVPIILDGENAWEYYRNDGRDFLLRLYEGLSLDDRLRTVTISDFIGENGKGERLGGLFPASWINADFGIWIGHEEDNTAWDYLGDVRNRLEEFERQNPGAKTEAAWKAIHVAEGSDWNWWYGEDHVSETQEDFDELFRLNLMKVFEETGAEIPEWLFEPVLKRDRGISPTLAIRGFIYPQIDGKVTSYYEWYQGAELDVKKSGGSMHKSESLLATIHFGFNKDYLFLRIDPRVPFDDFEDDTELSIVVSQPADRKIICPVKGGRIKAVRYEKVGGEWEAAGEVADVAVEEIFEIGIPFSALGAAEKDEIHLFVSVDRGGEEIERCPWRGHLIVVVPTENFEAMMWY